MPQYKRKAEVVDAVRYDGVVAFEQIRQFLIGTKWDVSDLAVDAKTGVFAATVGGRDERISIEPGMMIVKSANGNVHAMTPARFAAQWEAI